THPAPTVFDPAPLHDALPIYTMLARPPSQAVTAIKCSQSAPIASGDQPISAAAWLARLLVRRTAGIMASTRSPASPSMPRHASKTRQIRASESRGHHMLA